MKMSSQTSDRLPGDGFWQALSSKLSTSREINPNKNTNSCFSMEILKDSKTKTKKKVPINKSKKKIKPNAVMTSTTGIQVDMFHCMDCLRNHVSYRKEIMNTESDAIEDEECRVGLSEDSDVGENGGSNLNHVEEEERSGRCNVKRCRDRFGEGDGVDVHVEYLHSDDDDSGEDEQTNILKEDKNTTLSAYTLGSKDLTRICVIMFVMIFLYVCVMSWDYVSTKYISPILHYLHQPNQREPGDTEETSSLLSKFFDFLFYVTYTRF